MAATRAGLGVAGRAGLAVAHRGDVMIRSCLGIGLLAVVLGGCIPDELSVGTTVDGGTGGTGGGGGGAGGGTGGVGGAGGSAGAGAASGQPQADYAVAFGSVGEDRMGGVGTDATGRITFGGTHYGSIVLATTHESLLGNPFIAGLDSSLAPQWSLSFAVTSAATVRGFITGASGVSTFAGQTNSLVDFGGGALAPQGADAFVARFDAQGAHLFSAIYGNASVQMAHAAAGVNAGFVLGGTFAGSIDVGSQTMVATQADGFVARFDHNNSPVWALPIGGSGSQEVRAIAVDTANDRVFVAGMYAEQAEIGNVDIPFTGSGGNDLFVVALDLADGTYVDHVTATGGDHVVPRALAKCGERLYLAGSFHSDMTLGDGLQLSTAGFVDAFVAGLNSSLDHQWSTRYGGTGDDVARALACDDDGRVAVGGEFSGTVDFGAGPHNASDNDAFLMVLDAAGTHLWSGAYGGEEADRVTGVARDDAGAVVIAGEFSDTIDFGTGPLVSQGGLDLFVAKFPSAP